MKSEFLDYLKSIGFQTGDVVSSLPLVPTYYRTNKGDHFIQSAIHIKIFKGSNTPENGLGCVSFSVHGKQRDKHCRNVQTAPEVFKHVFCPDTAREAIREFDLWNEQRHLIMKTSWKKVL
jgi:hypothetical protein